MENNKLRNVIKPRRCLNNNPVCIGLLPVSSWWKPQHYVTPLQQHCTVVRFMSKMTKKNSMAGWISSEITCLWIFFMNFFLVLAIFLQFFVQNLTTALWKSSYMKWEQTVPLLLSDFLPHANIYYTYVLCICSYTKGVFLLYVVNVQLLSKMYFTLP